MLKINLDLAKTDGPYGRLSEEMRKITFHFPEIHEEMWQIYMKKGRFA